MCTFKAAYAIETIGNPLRSGKSFGFVSVQTTTSTVAANTVGVLLEVNVGPLSNSPTFMAPPNPGLLFHLLETISLARRIRRDQAQPHATTR